jgi:hypothetical protein
MLNTLDSERFFRHKFCLMSHRWPLQYNEKNPESLLYESCDIPMAPTNIIYLSCPSCCVRSTLSHSVMAEHQYKPNSLLTLESLRLIHT